MTDEINMVRYVCPTCKEAKHFIYKMSKKDGYEFMVICANCGMILPKLE